MELSKGDIDAVNKIYNNHYHCHFLDTGDKLRPFEGSYSCNTCWGKNTCMAMCVLCRF